MKKLLIAFIVLISLNVPGMSQSVKDTLKKSNVKVNTVPAKTVPDVTKSPGSLKNDSLPDTRYKDKVKGPVKKDGTINWGYKPNKKG